MYCTKIRSLRHLYRSMDVPVVGCDPPSRYMMSTINLPSGVDMERKHSTQRGNLCYEEPISLLSADSFRPAFELPLSSVL